MMIFTLEISATSFHVKDCPVIVAARLIQSTKMPEIAPERNAICHHAGQNVRRDVLVMLASYSVQKSGT